MKTVPKRTYTAEFRDAAVSQVIEGERSIASVARSLEMSSKSLANRVYQAHRGEALVAHGRDYQREWKSTPPKGCAAQAAAS